MSLEDHRGQSYIWKLDSAGLPAERPANIPGTVKQAVSPDGKLLAAGGVTGRPGYMSRQTLGRIVKRLHSSNGPEAAVCALAFSVTAVGLPPAARIAV